VYEGRIILRGDFSEARILFMPKIYSHLPRRAFPLESPRTFELTGNELSVIVDNILGGREYEIQATVTNETGQKAIARIKTPYIREFENVADDDDILIGAFYYPWYNPTRRWTQRSMERPLLGEYYSADPIIISKHIDWATGYGIDAFFISWHGPYSWEERMTKNFVNNQLIEDIKFSLIYGVDWEENVKRVSEHFRYINRTYFNHPSFLKIDEKPAIFLYLVRAYPQESKEIVENVRLEYPVYLIADLVYWDPPFKYHELTKLFDAVSAYNMHISNEDVRNNFIELVDRKYNEWFTESKTSGVNFIPQVFPGFNDTKVPGRENLPYPRSKEFFENLIRVARKYVDPKLNTMFVTSFNEWYENTQIEPSINYRFEYLQILKYYLTS
jgi:hypothetical protein